MKGSGQRWQLSSWPRRNFQFIQKRSGAGCWKKDFGARHEYESNTESDGNDELTLENWCNWMEVSTDGISSVEGNPA